MLTFGVEEEFIFLDAATLVPLDLGNAMFSEFSGDPNFGRSVHREFLACQLEFSSPVYRSLGRAQEELVAFRRRLAQTASAFDAVAAGVGTPFRGGGCPRLTPSERYDRLGRSVGAIVNEHRINGLHVHVAVPSREAGVQALNRLRPWLPVLLALSGNSPFFEEADTGFASWRAVHMRRWTTTGIPPLTADAADYDRREKALVGVGATIDRGAVSWHARLSPRFPTLEIRVADAQLDASDTVLVAGLCRALVETAVIAAEEDEPIPDHGPELLDAALWLAARDGLTDSLVSPIDGRLRPAAEVVAELRTHIDAVLRSAGDAGMIDALLARLAEGGAGAARQRAAFAEGGTRGLSELLSTPGSVVAPFLRERAGRAGF